MITHPAQHQVDNSISINTPMKHQNKTQYNQPDLSPSSSVRYSLSDSLPK